MHDTGALQSAIEQHGRYGGTGTVLSIIIPASWISYQWKRNSTEPIFQDSTALKKISLIFHLV